jgi:hypothetical protein
MQSLTWVRSSQNPLPPRTPRLGQRAANPSRRAAIAVGGTEQSTLHHNKMHAHESMVHEERQWSYHAQCVTVAHGHHRVHVLSRALQHGPACVWRCSSRQLLRQPSKAPTALSIQSKPRAVVHARWRRAPSRSGSLPLLGQRTLCVRRCQLPIKIVVTGHDSHADPCPPPRALKKQSAGSPRGTTTRRCSQG